MAVGWTKKNIAAMVATLDEDHPDIESAAAAALDTAIDLLKERAKYAVVGQVYQTTEHGRVKPDSEHAVKIMLDLYDSDTKANQAAAELSTSTSNGDRLATWVIPTFFGTPAGWHSEQRKKYAEIESKADEKRAAKFKASIEKFRQQTQDRADALHEMERKAGQAWPCPQGIVKRGECRHAPTCK